LHFIPEFAIRLWGAYTQQSNWQIFNTRNSSPLRESIFEPEVMATFGTGAASGLKLINIGWVHQSNGRSAAESRSWHRVYVLGGWEWDDTTSIMLRAWRRLLENVSTDDNPDIADFLGNGDLVVRWEPVDHSQSVALLLRNNFQRSNNRGFAQIDWATPVKFGNAGRTHLQISSGYGNGLLDYNHQQNTVGVGVSFREW
jgi:phospholipase A1